MFAENDGGRLGDLLDECDCDRLDGGECEWTWPWWLWAIDATGSAYVEAITSLSSRRIELRSSESVPQSLHMLRPSFRRAYVY